MQVKYSSDDTVFEPDATRMDKEEYFQQLAHQNIVDGISGTHNPADFYTELTDVEKRDEAQEQLTLVFNHSPDKASAAMSILGDANDTATASLLLISSLITAIDNLDATNPLKIALITQMDLLYKNQSNGYDKITSTSNAYLTDIRVGNLDVPLWEKYPTTGIDGVYENKRVTDAKIVSVLKAVY